MNRKYSLKKNEDIGRLVHLKQSVGSKYYAIYYCYKEQEIPKIAISVSKKYGNAVLRNYEKRVTRELLRTKIAKFNNLEALIVIKKEVANLKFEEKKEQIYYLIRKIIKIQGVRNEKH
jgi:ribonuclease P protein component